MKRSSATRGKTANRRPAKAGAGRAKAAALLKAAPDGGVVGLRQELKQKTRDLNEALAQQAATADVLKAISGSTDLQAVLSLLVQSAAKLCRADRAAIRLLKDGALHHLASYGFTAQQRNFMIKTPVPAKPHRGSIGGRVLIEGGIVQVDDAKADSGFKMTTQPAFSNVRTVLGVPLMRGATLIGLFIFSRKNVERFTDNQIALVSTFAAQAVIAIENARLFSELRQSLEQQTATSEVLRVISSSPGELEPVFQSMLENATRICEAKFGWLHRFDGEAFRFAAEVGTPPEFAEFQRQRGRFQPTPGSPLDRVMRTKRVSHIADFAAEAVSGPAAKLGSQRSAVYVPMLKDGMLIGAIAIYREEVRPFTDKQIALVQNFAAQAVIAIENTRLLSELRESLEQQTATADVLRVISSSPGDLEPVFQAVLANAIRICEARFGVLFRFDGEKLHFAAEVGTPAEYAEFQRRRGPFLPRPGTQLHRVMRTKKISHSADDAAEFVPGRGAELGGARSLVIVPMLKDDALAGVFVVYRQEVRPFTGKQLELLTNFAAQAVIAIENTRLLNELRQRTDDLTESLEQQTATSEVLGVISSSPGELAPVFQSMLENAVRICQAKFGFMFRYDGDAYHNVATLCSVPAYAELLQRGPIRPGPETVLRRIIETGQIAQTADIAAHRGYAERDPLFVASVELGGVRTIICVPMLKDKQLIGAMLIYRQEVRPFTEKQIALLTNFAAQAVIAIENTRLLSELRESLEQQTATAAVLEVISSSPGELAPVFDAMLENATRICGANFGNLWLREGDNFRVATTHGAPPAYRDYLQRQPVVVVPDAQSAMGQVVSKKQVTQIEDITKLPPTGSTGAMRNATIELAKARTLVAVPMLKENEVVGIIAIYRQEVLPFTHKQIELLANFAAQAVIAIENARLLSELRESLEQQMATAEVLRVISSSPGELEPVFQSMLENATRICEAKFGILHRFDGEAFHFAAGVGLPQEFAEFYVRRGPFQATPGTLPDRIMRSKQVCHTADYGAETVPGNAARLGGARSTIAVPMLKDDVLIGAILIYRQEVRPFTDKQIELLKNFAAQAVIAIENTRLLNELRQRTDDLSRSLEDLRAAQDRLVQTEKLASLGQLTAGIAHEIKNPLNFVNNFSSLSVELIDELQEELASVNIGDEKRGGIADLAGTLKGNLDKIAQHGKRADAIVKNMLLHSRSGSGEHRPVDVNALVEESLNLAYHGARAEKQSFNITLERSFDATVGEVDLYPQEVMRVLLNIIGNGFYAAHKRKAQSDGAAFEPTVTASTRNLGDRVEIRIRDNGAGIPPEVREKMFNPFFTTKPAGEGTGLGLSISHDIVVKQHAGTIAVDTEAGQFTEFTIVLPRSASAYPPGRPNKPVT